MGEKLKGKRDVSRCGQLQDVLMMATERNVHERLQNIVVNSYINKELVLMEN